MRSIAARALATGLAVLAAVAFGAAAAEQPARAAAQTWDVAADWSSTTSPSGAWTYGWSQTRGSAFSPMTTPIVLTGSATGLVAWNAPPGFPTVPMIHKNVTTSTVNPSCCTHIPAGTVFVHPGSSGQNPVVRWTAPAAGTYQVSVVFTGRDTAPTTTDVAVLLSGAQQFAGQVAGYLATQSYAATLWLQAGDVVDASVGFGADGNYFSDSTGLAMTVTQAAAVPTTLNVQPSTATIPTGRSQQFTATVADQNASPVVAAVTWSAPAAANCTAAGLCRPAIAGTYTVTATAAGLTRSATLTVVPATSWNVAADWVLGGPNPDGPWSYGWSTTLGSPFNLMTGHNPPCCPGTEGWAGPVAGAGGFFPAVSMNASSTTYNVSCCVLPAGGALAHPGPNGENAVIRWTAPAAGTYTVAASWHGLDVTNLTSTAPAVLHNGTLLYSSFVSGQAPPQSYAGTVSLAAGDVLDFALGVHVSYLYGTTAVAIQIDQVNVDTTPPVTTLTASPGANAFGWNNTDVTVNVSATDDLSGVAATHVTVSGPRGTVTPTGPFVLSAEGVYVITYSSVDNAGNAEPERTLTVRIDKTAPEGGIRFDPIARRLDVFGSDDRSGLDAVTLVSAVPLHQGSVHERNADREERGGERQTYQITDRAGNTTTLVVEVRLDGHELRASARTIRYGAGPVVALVKNEVDLSWALAPDRSLRKLDQTIGVGGDIQADHNAAFAGDEVHAKFRAGRGTRITVEEPKPKTVTTRPGLALLRLETTAGALRIAY